MRVEIGGHDVAEEDNQGGSGGAPGGGLGVLARGCYPPRQRSLIRHFVRHRETFEKLRSMLDEDRTIGGVSFRGVFEPRSLSSRRLEEVHFPEERYRTYCALLKQAGALYAIRDDEETRFLVTGVGFAGSGWRVGFVYRDPEPNNVIASLREFRGGTSVVNPNRACCPIAENWYIWILW